MLATSDPAAKPVPGLCVAPDQTIAPAYAIVSGRNLADLPGADYLIDDAGWQRECQPAPGWSNPQALLAGIRYLEAHPIIAKPAAMDPHVQM